MAYEDLYVVTDIELNGSVVKIQRVRARSYVAARIRAGRMPTLTRHIKMVHDFGNGRITDSYIRKAAERG